MKLADICVERPVFAVMLIAFLVTMGIFSYRELGVDLFPRADPATVYVGVELPGASPEEMTTSVVLPLEDAISSVSGLDEMSVFTSEGITRIICTFVLERDIEGAAQDVREKVAGAMNRLPPGVLPPVIRKVDPDSDPILTVLVSGAMSRRELTEIADKQVRRAIQTVNGVGEVSLTGGQARQIRILLDAKRLAAHNLTVVDVRNAVQQENVEAPGGHLVRGEQQLGLRTLGRVSSVTQFGDIIVATRGGASIRVRDIGRVEDGAEELRTWAMLRGKDVVSVDAAPVRQQHRARGRRGQAPPRKAQGRAAAGRRARDGPRHLGVHQGLGALAARTLGVGQPAGELGGAVVHPQLARGADRRARHSRFDHRHVHADALYGLLAEQHDAARIDTCSGHRDRRRDHRAREHFPVHGGEGDRAEARRRRSDARNRIGCDGHDPVAGDHLPAHCVHDGVRAALRQLVRVDDGDGHHGLAARQFHADPDAELAVS